METFGASAPLKELQKKFGFTPENIVAEGQAAGDPARVERLTTRDDASAGWREVSTDTNAAVDQGKPGIGCRASPRIVQNEPLRRVQRTMLMITPP